MDASVPKRQGLLNASVLCGTTVWSLMSLVLLLGALELALDATGVLHMGYKHLWARRLQTWDNDSDSSHSEVGDPAGGDPLVMQLVIRLVVLVVVCVAQVATTFIYHACYIKPTPEKYVPKNAIIPEDMKGSWKFGIFDCTGDCGTFCCFLWCPACSTAEMWYRAGWIHVLLEGTTLACTGWQFFAGIFGFCAMSSMAECCSPCVFAGLRGGVGWMDGGDGGMGDIVPLRKMFGIPHAGLNTFIEDCCCWCWCNPCLGTQEFRQVSALLDRGPLQVRGPSAAVVGNPVTVIGQVVPPAKE